MWTGWPSMSACWALSLPFLPQAGGSRRHPLSVFATSTIATVLFATDAVVPEKSYNVLTIG